MINTTSPFSRKLIPFYYPEQHPSDPPYYRAESDIEFAKRIKKEMDKLEMGSYA